MIKMAILVLALGFMVKASSQNVYLKFNDPEKTISSGLTINNKKVGYWIVYDKDTKALVGCIHYLVDSLVLIEEYNFGTKDVKFQAEGYEINGKIVVNGLAKTFFRNRLGYIDAYYVNGLLEGRQTWCNSEGAAYAIYEYKKGILNGAFAQIDSSGYPLVDGHYRNGKEDGFWITYYPTLKVKDSGYYLNGCKTGLWVKYYPNRKIMDSGYYLPDINYLKTTDSAIVLMDKNDTKIAAVTKNSFDSLLAANDIEWKPNKSLVFPLKIYIKNGIWRYYSEDGILKKEEYFDKGRLIKQKTR